MKEERTYSDIILLIAYPLQSAWHSLMIIPRYQDFRDVLAVGARTDLLYYLLSLIGRHHSRALAVVYPILRVVDHRFDGGRRGPRIAY